MNCLRPQCSKEPKALLKYKGNRILVCPSHIGWGWMEIRKENYQNIVNPNAEYSRAIPQKAEIRIK